MNNHVTAATVLVIASLTLGGCSIGGGSTKIITPTLGQELMDLNRAYKNGIIDNEEYMRLKKKLKKSL